MNATNQKMLRFKKIVTLNDDSFESIKNNILRLLYCAHENDKLQSSRIEYIKLKLTDSENNSFSKDLILEWATSGGKNAAN